MAEKNFLKVIDLDNKNPKIWFEYTKFCLRHDKFKKGEESLLTALKLQP